MRLCLWQCVKVCVDLYTYNIYSINSIYSIDVYSIFYLSTSIYLSILSLTLTLI